MVTAGGKLLRTVNDPNDYRGPGTGYRLSPKRRQEIESIPQALDPRSYGDSGLRMKGLTLRETGEARPGEDPNEVVVGLGPAFGSRLQATIARRTPPESACFTTLNVRRAPGLSRDLPSLLESVVVACGHREGQP
jgi:hypothetical protein